MNSPPAVRRLNLASCPASAFRRSGDVLPQIKEYERVSTTIVNAYVGPLVRYCLANLSSVWRSRLQRQLLSIILSHGWHGARRGSLAPCREARCYQDRPAAFRARGSAPSCSVFPAVWCQFDMGGTGTGISLISEAAHLSADGMLGGAHVAGAQPRHRQHRGHRRRDRSPVSMPAGDASRHDGPDSRKCRDRPATAMAARRSRYRRQCRCSGYISPTPPRSWADSARSVAAEAAAVDQVAASLGLSRLQAAAGIYG